MPFKLTLELVTVGPDGKRGKPRRVRGAHSWLKQAAQIAKAYLQNGNEAPVKEQSTGAAVNVNPTLGYKYASTVFDTNVPDVWTGIPVGTGGAAPTRDDFRLQGRISNATGVAGRLNYQDLVVKPLGAIAGGYRLTLEQSYLNDSGGDITINEVGVGGAHNNNTGSSNFFLHLRDVIPGGHLVPNGGAVIIRYHLDWLV